MSYPPHSGEIPMQGVVFTNKNDPVQKPLTSGPAFRASAGHQGQGISHGSETCC